MNKSPDYFYKVFRIDRGVHGLLFFIAISFFLTSLVNAQSNRTIRELRKMRKTKEKQIYLYKSLEDLEKEIKRATLFGLQSNDTVASIGAAWGRLEVAYGCLIDGMVFYLEDIDSTRLNQKELAFNLEYYNKLTGKQINSQYHIQLGSETCTNLPIDFFNKVLIVNSFHEFSKKEEMLSDIYNILKENGVLILDELVAKNSGEMHPGCGNQIYTETEIIDLISKEGFHFTRSIWDIEPGKHYAGSKVYIFQKSGDF